MTKRHLPTLYLKELWRGHHADLITVVTGIGFWVADHQPLSNISWWGAGVIFVLVTYLLYILRDAWLSAAALSGVVELPYSIVTNKPIEEAELLFENHAQVLIDQGFSLTRVFERFLISRFDWRYFNQDRLEDEKWRDLVRDIRAHLIRLSKRITVPARYHLFFVTPPAVALGLGAIVGRDIRSKAYQYFGPEQFVAIFDPERGGSAESYHRHQVAVLPYTEIKVSESGLPEAEDVGIVLQFVSHPLSPVATTLPPASRIMTVSHIKFPGHIPSSHDWMKIAVELSSLILDQASKGKRVHLFFGLSAALAFSVGHLVGDHNPISVYHYDKKRDRYVRVFSLNEFT